MIIQIGFLIVGFFILIKGADWLVDGSSSLARKNNISELAIGLTIVAFGTSMPELVVNTYAAYDNHADIAYGNIIGSNIFNLLAILGLTGLISPILVQSSTVWKEIPFSFFAIILLFILCNISEPEILSRIDAGILLIFFLFFLYYVFYTLKNDDQAVNHQHNELSNFKIWLYIIVGLGMLISGGKIVVSNAVTIAEDLGVSHVIIGLTIVSIGTSLPELVTSVVAALRKNNDLAVGNIIGSNIFNILLILGLSAMVRPLEYKVRFNNDLYFLGFVTILLFVFMFSGKKKELDRWEAGILLLIYIFYTAYLISKEIN